MKTTVTLFSSLLLSTAVSASEPAVQFARNTPYKMSEKVLMIQSLQKYCPELVGVNHRARFTEVKTSLQPRKYDQNMFDTVYTTVLHYHTNEAARFEGTVTIMGEKNYNEDEISSFSVLSDSEQMCFSIATQK